MKVTEINIVVWPRGPRAEITWAGIVDRFNARHPSLQVKTHAMSSADLWKEVTQMAISGHGPDITEVGTTWVHSLIGMNTLRPLAPGEAASLGGAASFIAPVWQAGISPADQGVYAVPWSVDTRQIYYRKDLLEAAGVAAQSAFDTPDHVLATLAHLAQPGAIAPLALPIDLSLDLTFSASWVWGAGGDFVDPAGTRAIFDQPAALAGLSKYFGLARYLTPELQNLDPQVAQRIFGEGNAAVTLSGPWMLMIMQEEDWPHPRVRANLGMVMPPGPPYVGGTAFVVWRHARHPEAIMEFIRYLTEPEFQANNLPGTLPARVQAWQTGKYVTDPVYAQILAGLQGGRTFSSARLWAQIESRLSQTFAQIWQDCFRNPQRDPGPLLPDHLVPLAKRINMALQP